MITQESPTCQKLFISSDDDDVRSSISVQQAHLICLSID